ncbi:hypothetical protein ZIOFF_005754 [Zingiber officinale]|uniref:Uncharacterized protein n=1 Tax=Zingiber officinale TaxID=94328 RepID=A0A8J5HMS2_ZINOF|nr:hypothetical protein ZIOFF_005754 [Zingiber officinale]
MRGKREQSLGHSRSTVAVSGVAVRQGEIARGKESASALMVSVTTHRGEGRRLWQRLGKQKGGEAREIGFGEEVKTVVLTPDWVYDNFDKYYDLVTPDTSLVSPETDANPKTKEIAKKTMIVGLWCIQIKPENRPSISMVINMLEGSIMDLQMPPKPEFS